jgi:AraC-like DNA-binding protein
VLCQIAITDTSAGRENRMDLGRLIELASRYGDEKVEHIHELPDLSIYRRDTVSNFEAVIYEPVICLILQGSKTTSVGSQSVDLRPGDALLISHDLPVLTRITAATAQKPYLALILSLDPEQLRSLQAQIADAPGSRSVAGVQFGFQAGAQAGAQAGFQAGFQAGPLSCAPADPAWLAPLVRYLELRGNPLDARVLGPSILREIHYRLLFSPIGQSLRSLLLADSHASRIARAIQQLRAGFRAPLAVSDLAKSAGMSASSFHHHFKSVTGATPIQYQKDLRLIEARALLAGRSHSVSQVAYAVGYQSPTQFSRDYSRKFGTSPSRDGLAPSAPARALPARSGGQPVPA